jgi:hypothetical protein
MRALALRDAIRELDAEFGAGFAKRHPELAAACIHAEALSEIAAALREVAVNGRSDHPLQSQTLRGIETALSEIAAALDGPRR